MPEDSAGVIAPPPNGATVINFDDAPAPCFFLNSTGPLTNKYAAQGVKFSGAGPNGGVVLDECGSFGVTGHSSPNFLAFNVTALNPDGGIPSGPEFLTFSQPVELVQMNVGHALAGLITLQCSGANGVIGVSTLTGTSALSTISVQGGAITSCVLSFTGTVLVVDDLAFAAYVPPVPTLSELALLALVLAMIGAGVLTLRA
ncbi:MAG: IPTL-CTERM sorting domain-containing protein [Thermoanaerobaculia bacterium]